MRHAKLILGFILLLAITVRVFCFVGLIGSDDLNYNRNAYAMATGTFTPQPNHQDTRVGLFLPVARLFTLFGVNELSSTAFPLFCSLVTLGVLVAVCTRYFGNWAGITAGILYTVFPLEVFQATQLLPDLPAAAFVAGSGMILFHAGQPVSMPMQRSSRMKRTGFMFLAGLLLGYAYLIKETSLFFAVFVLGYMGYRMWQQKNFLWLELWFWLGLLIMIGIEFGYYSNVTGNPFYRYVSVNSAHNVSIFSGRYFYGFALFRRLTLDIFRIVFHVPDFGFYYFFVFAGIVYGILTRNARIGYFIGWFLTLLLLFNFSSTSLSGYFPLLLFHRFFVLLTVPGIVIMVWYVLELKTAFTSTPTKKIRMLRLSLLIPFCFAFVVNLFWFSLMMTLFLVLIGLLFIITCSTTLRAWICERLPPRYAPIVLPVMLVYLAIVPGVYAIAQREAPRRGLICERELRPLFEFPLTHTVYTDTRTKAILEYFYQYQSNDRLKAFDESQTPGETCSDIETWENAYVIVNWERLLFLNRLYSTPIPQFLWHGCPQWKPYAQLGGEVNPCLVYEVP